MSSVEAKVQEQEMQAAREAWHPNKFGFREYGMGWKKELPGIGEVTFAELSWHHGQMAAYERRKPNGDMESVSILEFLRELQESVWGMDPGDTVPSNVNAILDATGGSTLVAYDSAKGFTPEGWYGFVFGFGSRNGNLVSHMAGVRRDLRGADMGWNLKVLQAHYAVESGHSEMSWTFDPMRGANANLNFIKLGGMAEDFWVDKYGTLRSKLYGDVPSDRFTVRWDLKSTAVQNQVKSVYEGNGSRKGVVDIVELPVVTADNVSSLVAQGVQEMRYQVPADIDVVEHGDASKGIPADQQRAIIWRREMRVVMAAALNCHSQEMVSSSDGVRRIGVPDPALSAETERKGKYAVTQFVSSEVAGERQSYYVLTRKV